MPGTKAPLIVIGDTDGLIALLHQEDAHFERAKETVRQLLQQDAQVIFPITTIVETVTTLTRKLDQPHLAADVIAQITTGELAIEAADSALLDQALEVFHPEGSKQNTLFDAFVVATAKKLDARCIFSFDRWYATLGYTLASDFVAESNLETKHEREAVQLKP